MSTLYGPVIAVRGRSHLFGEQWDYREFDQVAAGVSSVCWNCAHLHPHLIGVNTGSSLGDVKLMSREGEGRGATATGVLSTLKAPE